MTPEPPIKRARKQMRAISHNLKRYTWRWPGNCPNELISIFSVCLPLYHRIWGGRRTFEHVGSALVSSTNESRISQVALAAARPRDGVAGLWPCRRAGGGLSHLGRALL